MYDRSTFSWRSGLGSFTLSNIVRASTARFGKGTIDRPQFPVREEENKDHEYAAALRLFALKWVDYFVYYYDKQARRTRIVALLIRIVAVAALVFGSVILVCRMLSGSVQKTIMQKFFGSEIADVPAEIGLILFALAAGLIAADKFANVSENWMRYVVSSLSLQRMLVEFQMAGVNSSEWSQSRILELNANDVSTDPAQEEFDRIKSFLASVFDLVRHETQEWADEYRKNRSELEGYLKVQDAANKPAGGSIRKP